jgi:YVTN family beta-propeller protein
MGMPLWRGSQFPQLRRGQNISKRREVAVPIVTAAAPKWYLNRSLLAGGISVLVLLLATSGAMAQHLSVGTGEPAKLPTPAHSLPRLIATLGTGGQAQSPIYNPVDGLIVIPNYSTANVTFVSGTSVLGDASVGTNPSSGSYDAADQDVYVFNSGSNNASLFSDEHLATTLSQNLTGAGQSIYDSSTATVYVRVSPATNLTLLSGDSSVGEVNALDSISCLAYDPVNGYVYAGTTGAHTTVISGEAVIASVGTGDGDIDALAVNSSSGEVYAADGPANYVQVYQNSSLTKIVPVGSDPSGIVYDPTNGLVYVLNYVSDNVTVLKGTSVEANIPVGSGPLYAAVDTVSGDVYVANYISDNVTVLAGEEVLTNIQLLGGDFPGQPTFDAEDSYVYLPDHNNVSVISTVESRMYEVTFKESHLPRETEWWVNLTDGQSFHSSKSSISFTEPNGTYSYTTASADKRYRGLSGEFSVNGSKLTKKVKFKSVRDTGQPLDSPILFVASSRPSQ